MKALIIDESKMEQVFISRLLSEAGVNSDAAFRSNDACELIKNNSYDIVFVNYLVSDGSGEDVLADIRKADSNVKVIAMDSSSNIDREAFFSRAGFDFSVNKPLENKVLRYILLEIGDVSNEPEDEEWIKKVSLIDYAEGIKNCGSKDGFYKALDIFYGGIEKKAREIEGYLEGEDYKSYTIKVHALKSAARLIGAVELSEEARALEEAGNNLDVELIKKDTPKLLSDYRNYIEALSELSKDEEDDRELIDEVTLQEAYKSLRECIEMMDYDVTESVLDSISEYRLPSEDEEKMKKIRDLLIELEWEKLLELV